MPSVERVRLSSTIATRGTDLAKRLADEYPSAAGSVREGLDETLTVLTQHLSTRLQRSLATTNAVESLLSRTRHVKRNVKRWRGGQMMLRWVGCRCSRSGNDHRALATCWLRFGDSMPHRSAVSFGRQESLRVRGLLPHRCDAAASDSILRPSTKLRPTRSTDRALEERRIRAPVGPDPIARQSKLRRAHPMTTRRGSLIDSIERGPLPARRVGGDYTDALERPDADRID